MLKKSILALAMLTVSAHTLAASEPHSIACLPPVVQVSSIEAGISQYVITCGGQSTAGVTPKVTYSGEIKAGDTPPYHVHASYSVDGRVAYGSAMRTEQRDGQVISGVFHGSTSSIAALPAQLASQTKWDGHSGTLSIEAHPGKWHAYNAVPDATGDLQLVESGVASAPVFKGRAIETIELGKTYSRFAGKGVDLPVVKAELGLREGKFEFLIGESRAANHAAVIGALQALDKKPKDIARAWALASRAKFLGMDDEQRYAEQKVAAHNPQLLEEFQINLQNIKPYVLPTP